MTRYARKCSVDGKGMNSGFLFENEMYYCKNEEQAKEYVESLGLNWVKELKTIHTKKEWFYYTEWEEIDEDEFFDSHGNTYKLCLNCRKAVRVYTDFNMCKCENHL